VLVAALVSSPHLANAVLDRLGVMERGDVVINTEVATGSGDRVDLELRVNGAAVFFCDAHGLRSRLVHSWRRSATPPAPERLERSSSCDTAKPSTVGVLGGVDRQIGHFV
jgi:hypothetical protein